MLRTARRRTARRRTAGLAAAALSTLAVTALPTAAEAGTGSASGSATLLSSVDASGVQAAESYWTTARMAAAVPLDGPDVTTQGVAGALGLRAGVGAPAADTDAAPGGVAPSAGRTPLAGAPVVRGTRAPAVKVARPWTGAAGVTQRVGKVFFTRAGMPYVCSASSVDSRNASVVVTAGHCATEGGVPSAKFVFVPGYANGLRPFGTWAAQQLISTPEWSGGDPDSAAALNGDVAFAVLAPRNGRTLAATVGSFAISFSDTTSPVSVFGYPVSTRDDGETLKHCRGQRFADTAGTTDRGTNCVMAGGSSGGPWLAGFDPATGTGTVTSVVSFSYRDNPNALFGPVFGPSVQAAYTKASTAAVS
ncbi:trypsin-like serine peptidase [Kineococcus rubinsiae]|uniref:trypsin-like serine peptidase n=1 Tax=Kineococcus rubinsiae TaxID=2609562 RepID=UPI001430F311|nr:peptidase [Kineococcus rubinsiae]NIZ93414.1 peptidase [Kineococcus rubinsiae]